MSEKPRAPKVIKMAAGQPRVPEPHPADYSTPVPESTLALIDELCPQAELSSGKTLQRLEW